MRFLILVFTGCILIPSTVFGQPIPVIMRVASADQHDTLGYNLVTALTSEVYKLIVSQQVKIWDSPEKEIHITAASIRQIENSTGVSFLNQEIIFIYENWEKTKSGINTRTVGFKFSSRNARDEEVSFGFLDFKDVQLHFMKTRMPSNANGNYETTLAHALLKKQFHFNLIQFGAETITTGGASRDILSSYVGRLTFNPAVSTVEQHEKRIHYSLDFTPIPIDEKSGSANTLLACIESYLKDNEEVFFNMGGERIINHIRKGKIQVTRIDVNSFWKKYRDQITVETKSIQIYVNDSALNSIDFSDFLMWGIQCSGKSSYEMFKDREFLFTLRKINDADIPRKDAHLYLKALRQTEWNKLTEFVKYY